MATVVELQQQLETLRTIRSQGVLTVRLADGRTTTFRTDEELAAAMADLERQILGASGIAVHTVLVASSKGLET